MQIIEIKKLSLTGSILDVGSKKSISNVTNFLNSKEKINYANNHSNNQNDIKIDLEEINELKSIKFDNVLLFNVLEHIYNYKNCLKNCYLILKNDGNFYGSTPFFFRIHGSPNDYFRYTEQSILKSLSQVGFNNIEIKTVSGGIFICFFCSVSTITNKIPFLSNILLFFCQILDFVISLFSKNMKHIFPLGYFFQGRK